MLDIENCRTIDKPPNTANAADLVNSAADLRRSPTEDIVIEAVLKWIYDNKEWVFSGVGVAIGTVLVGSLLLNKRRNSPGQNQESGKASVNLQAAHDINIQSKNFIPRGSETIKLATDADIINIDPKLRTLIMMIKNMNLSLLALPVVVLALLLLLKHCGIDMGMLK